MNWVAGSEFSQYLQGVFSEAPNKGRTMKQPLDRSLPREFCFRCDQALSNGLSCHHCGLDHSLEDQVYTTSQPAGVDDFFPKLLQTGQVVVGRLAGLENNGVAQWATTSLPFSVRYSGAFSCEVDQSETCVARVGLTRCILEVRCSNLSSADDLQTFPPKMLDVDTSTPNTANPRKATVGSGAPAISRQAAHGFAPDAEIHNINRIEPISGDPHKTVCFHIESTSQDSLLSGNVPDIGIVNGTYQAVDGQTLPDLSIRIWARPDDVAVQYCDLDSRLDPARSAKHTFAALFGMADGQVKVRQECERLRRELDRNHLLCRFDVIHFNHPG